MKEQIDLLNREGYVTLLKDIIEAADQNNESKSICLYGKWGSGKSFVINLLKEKLKNDYLVIKYDAWERDFYDEPLIGILYSFVIFINERLKNKNTLDGAIEQLMTECLRVCLSIIGGFTKKIIGVDIPKEFKKVYRTVLKTRKKKEISVDFNDKLNIETSKKEVRDALLKLGEKIPIVFIVDEIDRCLPEYGLKVLERLHHFIQGVPKIQTIVSVDEDHLKAVVETFYGQDSSEKYLQKIFNFYLFLNSGNFNNSFEDRYSDYASLFSSKFSFIKKDDVSKCIKLIFENKNIRLVNETVQKAKLIHYLIIKNNPVECDYSLMCAELLLSYLSLIGKRAEVFERIFDKHRCNPLPKNTYYSNGYYEEDNLNSFNTEIDKVNSSINFGGIDGWVRIDNLWNFLWYIIISNNTINSTFRYSFTCVIGHEDYSSRLNLMFNFIKKYSNQCFII